MKNSPDAASRLRTMVTMSSKSFAIILAGGSGTRLWPLSRNLMPKQLLTLNQGKSLLQQTAARLIKHTPPENVVTVTHANQSFEVMGQLYAVHPDLAKNVLIEPVAKNTLPAISWAVSWIAQKEPDARIGVFSSDQAIQNEDAFYSAWEECEHAALLGYVALFGVQPTSPAVGYGYIRAGESLSVGSRVKKVESFVEKPDAVTAERYLKEKNYYWNGGMFVFTASRFLKLLEEQQPQISVLARQITQHNEQRADVRLYGNFTSVSIDYGLMEKISDIVVIPVDMGWTDLGSWESVYQFLEKNADANVMHGSVLNVEGKNNLLWSDSGFLAAFGVSDVVVIQTRDATLVCPRDKTDELKSLIGVLEGTYPHFLENHATVSRPWGSYTVLEEGPRYKIKKITVKPGGKLSLQMHHHRSEHWVVVSGEACIQKGDAKMTLKPNESTFISKGEHHRLTNPSNVPLNIIEVQIGDYVGEDDIVRFDDIYGR